MGSAPGGEGEAPSDAGLGLSLPPRETETHSGGGGREATGGRSVQTVDDAPAFMNTFGGG